VSNKRLKTYIAKTLFDGSVIGKEGKYIAIPNKLKDFKILVKFNNQQMTIEKWLNADGFRRFPDKFGRKDSSGNTLQYTLGYFKWNPIVKEQPQQHSIFGALAQMPPEQYEKLRAKLHSKKVV